MTDSTQLADQFLHECSVSPDPVVSISKDKRVIHCVDNNNGSYQSGVVTIDATSQLNGSTGFGSLRDAYLAIPYVVTMKNNGATALGGAVNKYCIGMKTGVWNVIDSLSVELNGKSIITDNDYKLYWNNLRAMTEWSASDISKHGADAFMYPDDWQSMSWSSTSSASGDGYTNNFTDAQAAVGLQPEASQVAENIGFINRVLANPNPVAAIDSSDVQTGLNPYGWATQRSGVAQTIAVQNGKGAFVTTGVTGNVAAAAAGKIAGTWYYMLKIRLMDLHPIFKELDLIANPQIKLKLRFNQGYCDIATGAGTMSLTSTTLTSGNTVPVMVASAAANNAMASIPVAAGSLRVAFGPLQNSLTTLSTSGAFFPFTTTRLYIPFYDLANPSQIVQKPIKKVNYLDCYAQYFTQKAGTGVSTTQQNIAFSFQLSASLKNIKYIALIPYAETSTGNFSNSTANLTQQFASPFDSAPWTCQPGSSVRSFQVQVGNENVFNKTIDYDYEAFYDEFKKLAAVNGSLTHEISNGLVDLQKWSTVNRVLVADCSRITNPEVPQSILISGVNSCCQGSNYLVLVVYQRSLSIDRLTGEVTEYD